MEQDLTNVEPEISTVDLVRRAKRAGNLQPRGANNVQNDTNSNLTSDCIPIPARKRKNPETDEDENGSSTPTSKRKLKNSDIFPPSVRPDWLLEDRMINSLPRATVASVIAQSKMTEAINRQNKLREASARMRKSS